MVYNSPPHVAKSLAQPVLRACVDRAGLQPGRFCSARIEGAGRPSNKGTQARGEVGETKGSRAACRSGDGGRCQTKSVGDKNRCGEDREARCNEGKIYNR